METQNIQNILNQISAISEKYKRITEITGENFNVFRVLEVEASEVRMHSAFLAELLNPKGSHEKSDVFLKLFISHFNIEDFETANATVEVEKNIGGVNEDYTEGGRIDIVIRPLKGKTIFIENKIYASDQPHQLLRYHNYDENASLIYLTLDGHEPSEESTGSNIEKHLSYKNISYKIHILDWLELCRKETVIYPILRETISQYINLIKYLTGQTINDNMNKEVISTILSNAETLESAFTVIASSNSIKEELIEKLHKQLFNFKEEFEKKYQMKFEIPDLSEFGNKNTGVFMYNSNWKYFKIGFAFDGYCSKFYYGIKFKDENFNEKRKEIDYIRQFIDKEKFKGDEPDDNWPWYKWMESPSWFNQKEPFIEILKGDLIIRIKKEAEFLIELMKRIEKNTNFKL